jgi:hypothetical protein
MISEYFIAKYVERSSYWVIWDIKPRICLEGIMKTMRDLMHGRWHLGQGVEQVTLQYKLEALLLEPICLAFSKKWFLWTPIIHASIPV